MSSEFVGHGWSFPLGVGRGGGIAMVAGDDDVERAIRIVLSTAPGERPMRPEFGCGIHQYVFAPADAGTAGALAFEVSRALERWEPRIDVLGVDVDIDPDDQSVLYLTLTYAVRGTNDPRNLVFPFYVIPTEETV